jgi:soluble cytochrome b562
MKLRHSLALTLVMPLLAPALMRADTASPAPAAAPAAAAAPAPAVAPAQPDADKDTDLEVRMKRIAKAFRQLRKQVADPTQNASSLQLVATMAAAAKEAEDMKPAKTEDIPADQQDKFVADFKAGIKDLEDRLGKLSDALAAGKNDVAAQMQKDLFEFEKKSHKEFKRPEKS